MAQDMKLLLTDETGQNLMVELCSNETFEEFQQKVFREQNVCITVEDFQMFFENLTPVDNLFNCLREALNLGNDTNNGDMIYEIYVGRNLNIKNEQSNFVLNNTIENTNQDIANYDPSMMILNEEPVNQFTPLNENIFDTPDIPNSKPEKDNDSPVMDKINNTELTEPINENGIAETSEVNNINLPIEDKPEETTDVSMKPADTIEDYSYMDIESKMAEMHECNEEVITDLCRLCAKNVTAENKIEIFDQTVYIHKIEEKINGSLPIRVNKEDGLPQQICGSCTDRLKHFYDFVQDVIEADKQLRVKFPNAISSPFKNISNSESIREFMNSSPVNNVSHSKNIKLEDNIERTETEFETEYLEENHQEEKIETDKRNCRLCDLIIENLDEAVSHGINIHQIENLYACVFCELGFEHSEFLDQHVRTEHKNLFLRKYQCNLCFKKFSNQFLLLKHTCLNAANKTLHCEVCNQAFSTKIRLNFHRQFHIKDARPLHCSACNITFKTENEMFDHVTLMHETYPCDMCNKVFNNRSLLNNHKRNHTGIHKHKCDTCNKLFFDKQSLAEHEMTHLETKLYQCHICGKNLNRLSRLRKHLLTHETNPVVSDIHVCNVCKEAFADQTTAEIHKSTHHDGKDCIKVIATDKVFRCEFCEKCFHTPLALNEHRSIHTGPTPYICHICNAEFSSYPRCTTHKTTHGLCQDAEEKDNFPVVKHFLCEHCGKSYLLWTYLGLHRRLKHSETAQSNMCVECNHQFPNSWSLAYHRKTKHPQETFKCNICNKILANEHCLKLHNKRKHSQKDNQCVVCGKIFQFQTSLETHLRSHKGLKEFKCALCPKAFVDLQGLTRHFEIHKARRFVFPEDKSESPFTYLVDREDRPFACDICGLSFRRQFTLKNHKLKHVKPSESGSFVLMVDMKEDEGEEENKIEPQPTQIISNVGNKPQEINYVQIPVGEDQTQNYIDIGNGNFVPIQGNTINLDGKQYILVDENGKSLGKNQEFEMIVDETLREEVQQPIPPQEQFDNTTVMYVDDTNYVMNENTEQPNYIVTNKNIAGGTTYVIDGNEFLIQPEEQTF